MYKITRTTTDNNQVTYVVGHYVTGDDTPTPGSEKPFVSRPDAWTNALGRAAKQASILNKPMDVITDDGRVFRVSVNAVTRLNQADGIE